MSGKSIKRYLSALKSFHKDLGYSIAPFSSQVLERVIRGIRRYFGDVERRERLPITHPILSLILSSLSNSSLPKGVSKELAITLRAAYSLSFAAFLRCGEVTYDVFDPAFNLKRRDIIMHNDHFTVDIPASKTDPFRQGVRISIACTDLDTCPHVIMTSHLARPGLPEDPLFFGRHQRSGNGCGAFTRKIFIECLKSCLTSLGISSEGYSGHSFRRGAATWARMVGLSDLDIQRLGRWTSDCFKLYIDTQPDVIVALNRRLHVDIPPTRPTTIIVPPSSVWRGDDAL